MCGSSFQNKAWADEEVVEICNLFSKLPTVVGLCWLSEVDGDSCGDAWCRQASELERSVAVALLSPGMMRLDILSRLVSAGEQCQPVQAVK